MLAGWRRARIAEGQETRLADQGLAFVTTGSHVRCMVLTGPMIRAARELVGWSQDRLGLEAGLARNTVITAEQDPTQVSIRTRRAILDALGRSDVRFIDKPVPGGRRWCGVMRLVDATEEELTEKTTT